MRYVTPHVSERLRKGKSYSPKRWRIKFDYTDDSGKRICKTFSAQGTKTDAQKEAARIAARINGGTSMDGEQTTFAEYAAQWVANRERNGTVSKRTIDADRQLLSMLCGQFGNVPLAKVSAQAVEDALTEIKASRKGRKGDSLSGTTMKRVHQKGKQVFKDAANADLVMRNPFDRVRAPKEDTEEKKFFSGEELARLTKCASSELRALYSELAAKEQRMHKLGKRYSRAGVRGISSISFTIAVLVGAATGARAGEVFGLRWSDVSEGFNAVTIRQSLAPDGTIGKTKTGKSRTVGVSDATARMLAEWKAKQGAALNTLGIPQEGETPILCSDVGKYVSRANFEKWRTAWGKEHGFGPFGFHQLRHTHATQLLANGVDAKTVSERLGHSSAAMTLDVYAHAIPGNDAVAAQVIGAIMESESVAV